MTVHVNSSLCGKMELRGVSKQIVWPEKKNGFANVTLTVNGNRLTWSSERGKELDQVRGFLGPVTPVI